jgi:hypothetical protein
MRAAMQKLFERKMVPKPMKNLGFICGAEISRAAWMF